VAAFDDFEHFAFVELGAAIIPVAGEGGPAGEHVELGEGVGRLREGERFVEDGGDETGEEFTLAGECVFLGVEDFLLLLFELLGDVALPPTVVCLRM